MKIIGLAISIVLAALQFTDTKPVTHVTIGLLFVLVGLLGWRISVLEEKQK